MDKINKQELTTLLKYIESYWNKIIIRNNDSGKHNPSTVSYTLSVPYTRIVPNDAYFTYIF